MSSTFCFPSRYFPPPFSAYVTEATSRSHLQQNIINQSRFSFVCLDSWFRVNASSNLLASLTSYLILLLCFYMRLICSEETGLHSSPQNFCMPPPTKIDNLLPHDITIFGIWYLNTIEGFCRGRIQFPSGNRSTHVQSKFLISFSQTLRMLYILFRQSVIDIF